MQTVYEQTRDDTINETQSTYGLYGLCSTLITAPKNFDPKRDRVHVLFSFGNHQPSKNFRINPRKESAQALQLFTWH